MLVLQITELVILRISALHLEPTPTANLTAHSCCTTGR